MLERIRQRVAFTALASALLATPAAAQNGTITGRVSDFVGGQPIARAEVRIVGGPSAITNRNGEFHISVAPGVYAIEASFLGFRPDTVAAVPVGAGESRTVDISLRTQPLHLPDVTITATKEGVREDRAPPRVHVVRRELIEERAAVAPVEHVRGLAGIDVAQSGISQYNVVTRGFNNVFSGSLLVITDNRYASVPSLRLNAYNMIPLTSFDPDRIEVLLGPASALYGPNSANGVLHIITSSPLSDPGTAASVAMGERNLYQAQFRHASRITDRAGFKVSGQYLRADDWESYDPAEVLDRDFRQERFGGEVRFDARPWNDSDLIFNAGMNQLSSGIEMTGIGAGQVKDWRYSYFQTRFRLGRLFAQAFVNQSDAGETRMLRTEQYIEDESRMIVGQVQHGLTPTERLDLIWGVDLQHTEPRTNETITGRNEDDDIVNEVGGYVHATLALTPRLDLVGALRADHHSRLEDLVYSPRTALLFRPVDGQTFRATFNRAFSTPTTNNLFLDILAATLPIPVPFNYGVRTLGVPSTGFTFSQQCQGGFEGRCMVSPLSPGNRVPANAAPFWNALVQSAVPAALQPALLNPGSQPGDPELASMLRRFNQEERSFLEDPDGPQDIAPLRPTITNTYEVGYKGVVGQRLLVSADVYHSRIRDFVGPLRVETPSVFFSPASVQAFVLHRLGGLIAQGGVTPQQAAEIITAFSSLPVGTVAPDGSASSELILTYRNFGDVSLGGAELAFQFLATEQLSLTGSASFVTKDCVDGSGGGDCSGSGDVALNAPKLKGSVGARWSDAIQGFSLDGRLRVSDGFPMNSGVYVGRVDGHAVVDMNATYRLPRVSGASATLTVNNLLDRRHRQFVGAPELGRLALVRLTYRF